MGIFPLTRLKNWATLLQMKLLGRTNGKQVIASIAHHDYVSVGEGEDHISADGGQLLTANYAGYDRGWGKVVWFEISQNFAELYSDYQFRSTASGIQRKYGIWKLEDVKILPESEYPDPQDPKWKIENAIWGTRSPSGKEPLRYIHLKDTTKEHLENIILSERISQELREIILEIIKTK
jgi:hypothetical protein